MTLVSIITPSYNQAQFLEHTLQSVLQQEGVRLVTTKDGRRGLRDDSPIDIDLEYFVIDGGSTDGSLSLIDQISDRLAGWVSEKDQGQAEAINKGFARARGEIIAWLNSDDLLLPGAVRKAVETLQANPDLGMVYGDAITIDPDGRPLSGLSFGNWGLIELLSFRMICQPAVFMRREVLEQAGYLDESYHFMLDHHLWIRLARLAPIQHISEVLAAARHHPQAKNVSQAAAFSAETQRVLKWALTQPDLSELFHHNRRLILGGAYRLQARYYLEGGQSARALEYYLRALVNRPGYALKHAHRMLYALLSLLGATRFADHYLRRAASHQKQQALSRLSLNFTQLKGWQGINADLDFGSSSK